jgi:hypothetical protein
MLAILHVSGVLALEFALFLYRTSFCLRYSASSGPEGPLAQIDAQLRRRRTLQAIAQILLREAQRQPLVSIFKDSH